MAIKAQALPRTVQIGDAARYLGVSKSLMRLWRLRGPDDPGEKGPAWSRLSRNCVIYEVSELDRWLNERLATGLRRAAPKPPRPTGPGHEQPTVAPKTRARRKQPAAQRDAAA